MSAPMLLTLSVDVDHDEVDQLKQTHYAPYPSNYPCARIWTQNWHICANISPFRRNIANECSRACRMNTRTLPMSDVMWRRQNSITRLPIDSPHQGLQMVLFWWAVAAVMVHTHTTICGAEARVMVSTAQGFYLNFLGIFHFPLENNTTDQQKI